MSRIRSSAFALIALCCFAFTVEAQDARPASSGAHRTADTDAINRLIDRYNATEDAMDMTAQSQLMTADRVWMSNGAGRRTDNADNMRIQQAYIDAMKKDVPGIRSLTEDRDRLIKFYGDGSVAIASFYRYTHRILPPNTSAELAKVHGVHPPEAVTLVLEKKGADWKIVHTHSSALH